MQFVADALDAGHDVMLEVDVQGALAVKRVLPEALLVFVRAPSREEQRRRLEARGSETEESIGRRLARAEAEERTGADAFDAVAVNDDVERDTRQAPAVLRTRRGPRRPPPGGPP